MRRRLSWCLVVTLYWAIVVSFLLEASPVFFDGAGPMPSFYWGKAPLPDLGEYYKRRCYYDCLYSLPYIVVAVILTTIGCGVAPLLSRRLKPSSSGTFVGVTGVTLALILLSAFVSDAAIRLGLWGGTLIVLHGSFDLYQVSVLSKLFLPASLLSGVVEVGKGRYTLRD